LLPADAAIGHDQQYRLEVLGAVLQQVQQVGDDRLAATVSQALKAEEKRAHGNRRANPHVGSAMWRNYAEALERRIQAGTLIARAHLGEKERRTRLRDLREAAAKLEEQRLALHNARSVVECLDATKAFETRDLGQGHPRGGAAEHFQNRMQVLERIRLRGAPLPPHQANDWEWFKKNWDHARIAELHPAVRDSWGSTFKNIALDLLARIRNGEHDALSKWMASEGRQHLGVPALRV
jgi:hypothetical protein